MKRRIAHLTETASVSASSGSLVGFGSGVLVGSFSLVSCAPQGKGFLASFVSQWSGLVAALAVASLSGALLGMIIGLIEGVACYAIAARFVQRRRPLRDYFLITGGVLALVNGFITSTAIGMSMHPGTARHADASSVTLPIFLAASLTVAAVGFLTWIHTADWPVTGYIPPPRSRVVDVRDPTGYSSFEVNDTYDINDAPTRELWMDEEARNRRT